MKIVHKFLFLITFCILVNSTSFGQDYFLKDRGPFNSNIPSPEEFLGYAIGTHHTRHDKIVAYFERLAELSNRATIYTYGRTYGHRDLIMLTVTTPEHLNNIESIQKNHLTLCDPKAPDQTIEDLPVFIQLGYNVHGNEPSGAEAALLTAYTLVASENPEILEYLQNSILFIDPVINPDGRDRHTHWVNMHKGNPLVADPNDIEHNEGWPRGRTNHYWFDLNRDWWLGVHPESQGKLNWYHQWYPNVVTDFHEMGTNSTHFFEPMKTNGSKDPIMPVENYTTLNETFAKYFAEGLDEIGSLYFTKEVFDGTYPGYGSSYPDLQGGLGLLFEQASSRGHVQKTEMGDLSFAFTIRNQYVSSMATVKASLENKDLLHNYQRDFFKSALTNASDSGIEAYIFGDNYDNNRLKAFMEKLLLHRVDVYSLPNPITLNGHTYHPGKAFLVPTNQVQYRMVQSAFETYDEYHDSVFYDASAWSLANFFNLKYAPSTKKINVGDQVTSADIFTLNQSLKETNYAYMLPADDYNIPAFIQFCLNHKLRITSIFKPLTIETSDGPKAFGYGSIMIPVAKQEMTSDSVYKIVLEGTNKLNLHAYGIQSGYSISGVDLGSRYAQTLQKPKILLIVGDGVSSYEAGEVWHLLDQRVHLPITKITQLQLKRIKLHEYNTLVLVSGNYSQLDSSQIKRLKTWASEGNTIITLREGSKWAIEKKLIKENLVKNEIKKDSSDQSTERLNYMDAPEQTGREEVGGTIFKVELDLTHPLAFGYSRPGLPVYRNSEVWIKPSKNPYCNVAAYSKDPHIDGFITKRNMDTYLKKSASVLVSKIGSGRAILFAENPNFRGAWYGTNRLFLNAIFLGNHIRIPTIPE